MNNKTIAIIAAIILVGTIAAIPSFKAALADESAQKVAEKHQSGEDKHGFGSHQEIS